MVTLRGDRKFVLHQTSPRPIGARIRRAGTQGAGESLSDEAACLGTGFRDGKDWLTGHIRTPV